MLSRWKLLKVFSDPSYHEIRSNNNAQSTTREFNHAIQRKRLFFKSSFEFFITVILCFIAGMLLYAYSLPEHLSDKDQQTFNLLITALQIGIGINLTSSLRSYAKMLRWRILASSYRSLREFDMILKCAEQTSVLKLIWICRRRSRYWAIPTITQLVCVVWISINFTGAIAISFLGLYYSSSERDLSWVFTETGSANVLNLVDVDLATIELSAIEHRHCGRFSTLDLSKSSQDKGCLAADSRICSGRTYNFQDRPITQDRAKDPLLSNNTRRQESLVVFGPSERFIDINTSCASFKITSEPSGNNTNITYIDKDIIRTRDIYSNRPGGIVYIYDPSASCGSRCAVIDVYYPSGQQQGTLPHFYSCASNISQVFGRGDHIPAFQFSDDKSRKLAAAIALDKYRNESRFCRYDNGDDVDIPGLGIGTPDMAYVFNGSYPSEVEVAAAISTFSQSTIATLDQGSNSYSSIKRLNLKPQNEGDLLEPYYPAYLTVNWAYAICVLALIVGLQLITLLAVIAYANKAIVKDDSNLSIAKLLMPMVERLGDRGCLLTGDEIIQILGGSENRAAMVRYSFGIRYDSQAVDRRILMHVGIYERGLGFSGAKKFEEGLYDGGGGRGNKKLCAKKRRSSF